MGWTGGGLGGPLENTGPASCTLASLLWLPLSPPPLAPLSYATSLLWRFLSLQLAVASLFPTLHPMRDLPLMAAPNASLLLQGCLWKANGLEGADFKC